MDEREAQMLKNRLAELERRSSEGGYALYSDFLDLYGQDIFLSQNPSGLLLGGYCDAERKIACFSGRNPPISFVSVTPKNKKFTASFSHRDILGALMGLGIRRETLGDITVGDGGAVVICLDKVADFIIENLTSVGRTAVLCEICQNPHLDFHRSAEQLTVFTSSTRADALVAAVYRLSRSESQRLIAGEKVFVSGRLVTSPGTTIPENAPVSVRGFGRFTLKSTAKTKKERLRCSVELA